MSGTHWFGAKVAKYVNLRAPGADQELPPHEVFNNALTIAESVGEKPSVELFKHIDNEYAEAKQKEKMAMNLIQFGAKVAADPRPMNPDPNGARDHLAGHIGAKLTRDIGLIKKLRQQGQLPPSGDVSHLFPEPPTLHSPDPRPLNRLWSTPPDQRAPNPYSVKPAAPTNAPPTIKGAYAFGAKIAASSCAPCDMPNGPTNKKHMTGASPAVLEADEASEAIKPKTTETKHDKSVVTGKEARTKKSDGPFTASLTPPDGPFTASLTPQSQQALSQLDNRYMRNRGIAGQVVGGLAGAVAGPIAGAGANLATRAGLNHAAGDVALKGIVPGAGTGKFAVPGGEKQLLQRAVNSLMPSPPTVKGGSVTKKASPVGLPPVKVNPAINIQLPSVHDVAKQTALFTAPIGAVVGGAIGGFGSKKDKLRNTLLGALKGTAVGAAGGAGTVYGGRYLPELIGNTTGMSAAVPSAVLAGGAGGGLLAGGLTSAGFDAIAGNNDEEEPKKQAQAFGRRVAKEIKRAFELGPAPAKNKGPAVSPYTADFLGGMPQRTFTPSELENELRQRTDSVYPQIQPRPTLNPKPENIFNYSGPRNSVDDFLDAYSSGSKAIINTIGKGLYQLPSSLYNMAGLAGDLSTNYTSATRGSVPSSYAYGMGPASASGQFKKPGTPAAKAETPAAPPAASSKPSSDTSTGKPGMFDGIDARTALMYGLPIGLGGAGLYGLYNYLNSKPKKKTEDEKEKA